MSSTQAAQQVTSITMAGLIKTFVLAAHSVSQWHVTACGSLPHTDMSPTDLFTSCSPSPAAKNTQTHKHLLSCQATPRA